MYRNSNSTSTCWIFKKIKPTNWSLSVTIYTQEFFIFCWVKVVWKLCNWENLFAHVGWFWQPSIQIVKWRSLSLWDSDQHKFRMFLQQNLSRYEYCNFHECQLLQTMDHGDRQTLELMFLYIFSLPYNYNLNVFLNTIIL